MKPKQMYNYNGNALYFHDPMGEGEEEMKDIYSECYRNGLIISDMIHTDVPPFKGFQEEKQYDCLFFDWGGMSIGNSLMEHFCKRILAEAKDNPSRTYIMASSFTKFAMQDALETFGDDAPCNVFLDIESGVYYLINYGNTVTN